MNFLKNSLLLVFMHYKIICIFVLILGECKRYIYSHIKTCLTYICISIYEICLKHEHTHVVTDKYEKVQFRRRKQHF